jgi:prepilin-type N-terminal cleavage/methylation domain-containing protein
MLIKVNNNSVRKVMKKNYNTKAFTLIELLVVISIIAVLMSILLPSLNRARAQAKAVVCKSNLRNLYIAEVVYTEDFDGWFPSADKTQKLGGHWPFRAAKGYRSKYDRRGLPETFGINALFDEMKYVSADSDVWICPDLGMKWMKDYECTYSFSLAGNLSKNRMPALVSKYPSSLLLNDNVTHYTPTPVGFYVSQNNRPSSTIPLNERVMPHKVLGKQKKNQYGEIVPDYNTFMMVTYDGWVGTNGENKERMKSL